MKKRILGVAFGAALLVSVFSFSTQIEAQEIIAADKCERRVAERCDRGGAECLYSGSGVVCCTYYFCG